MAVPSPGADEAPPVFQPDQDDPGESERERQGRGGLLMVAVASFVALIIGIGIGNAARKKIDRMGHGY